jgi:hypothetical protein
MGPRRVFDEHQVALTNPVIAFQIEVIAVEVPVVCRFGERSREPQKSAMKLGSDVSKHGADPT